MSDQNRLMSGAARFRVWARVMFPSLAIAACAANTPYNPEHLSSPQVGQVGQVAEICQTVMGFEPSQPLADNLWPGDPDPQPSTNDYRGCVASLSSSLQGVPAVWAEKQAQDDCRASGLQPGSSELGTCVLRAIDEAAPSESRRRERLACAEIGLEPGQRAFESCVNGLKDVQSAKTMSDAYRNR